MLPPAANLFKATQTLYIRAGLGQSSAKIWEWTKFLLATNKVRSDAHVDDALVKNPCCSLSLHALLRLGLVFASIARLCVKNVQATVFTPYTLNFKKWSKCPLPPADQPSSYNPIARQPPTNLLPAKHTHTYTNASARINYIWALDTLLSAQKIVSARGNSFCKSCSRAKGRWIPSCLSAFHPGTLYSISTIGIIMQC